MNFDANCSKSGAKVTLIALHPQAVSLPDVTAPPHRRASQFENIWFTIIGVEKVCVGRELLLYIQRLQEAKGVSEWRL